MSGKTHYDTLGVQRTASAEEIRQAYLLRSKVLHPDRFDAATQAREWKMANELLRELNDAYAVLRETRLRGMYDATIGVPQRGRSEGPKQTSTKERPPPTRASSPTRKGETATEAFKRVQSGSAKFSNLYSAQQSQLATYFKDIIADALLVEDRLPTLPRLYLSAGLLWFLYLILAVFNHAWSQVEGVSYLLLSVPFGFISSVGLQSIIASHRGPLPHRKILTPLFLISTGGKRVHFWPIWELRNIQTRVGVSLSAIVEGRRETIRFRSPDVYSKFVDRLNGYRDHAKRALEANDAQYFIRNNWPDGITLDRPLNRISPTAAVLHVTISAAALFSAGYLLLRNDYHFHPDPVSGTYRIATPAPQQLAQIGQVPAPPIISNAIPGETPWWKQPQRLEVAPLPPASPSPTAAPRSAAQIAKPPTLNDLLDGKVTVEEYRRRKAEAVANGQAPPKASASPPNPNAPWESDPIITPRPTPLPEMPLPANGQVQILVKRERIAPFRINAASTAHFFVKLRDATSGKEVLNVFVRSGSYAEIKIPLGTYRVTFGSGEHWYGPHVKFGRSTKYKRADDLFAFTQDGRHLSGHEITLYAVPGGNMKTDEITEDEF